MSNPYKCDEYFGIIKKRIEGVIQKNIEYTITLDENLMPKESLNNIELYVDLEDTIIDTLASRKFLYTNINRISSFAKEYGIKEGYIFSLAINNEGDLNDYGNKLKKKIENKLGISIKGIVNIDKTVKDILSITSPEIKDIS